VRDPFLTFKTAHQKTSLFITNTNEKPKGINLSFAKALVAKGCNVLIADLSLRPEAQGFINSTTSAGTSSTIARAVFEKCDVTSWTQLQHALDATERAFGAIDIVCPGAGVFEEAFSNFWIPPGTGESVDTVAESRYKLLDINLTHPIRLTQLAIEHFVAHKKGGNVVNITSIAGQLALLPTPMYIASKWGG
jgi:3-hydroxybutyrate dehydrogenase